MAGDWIRMRVGLTTHPRVMRIAECLAANDEFCYWAGFHFHMPSYPMNTGGDRENHHAALRVTRYVTVTALLKFWSYANEHAKGDFVAGIWPEDVDEITGVPGFSGAIAASGWAIFQDSGGMELPNFSEHNTAFLQRNSDAAERQKRYRERKREGEEAKRNGVTVTRDVTSNGREEKRREESLKTLADETQPPVDNFGEKSKGNGCAASSTKPSTPKPSREEVRKKFIESKASSLKMTANPGEAWKDFAARVQSA